MRVPERERYWETVVENLADGLMIVDPEGKIVYANQSLEEITGYAREELVGQSCQLLKCDTCRGLRPRSPDKRCDLFTRGSFKRIKCVLIRKDGRPLPFLKNASVIRDGSGRIVGGVETFTDLTEILSRDQVISYLRQELDKKAEGFHGLLGRSPAMLQLFELLTGAAHSDAPVVLYGESGTGKELAASALHRLSPRSPGPFIRVNSAALNESLLESELFGHVKGAFTGADRNRMGRFEASHRGSIFLDEIGDMPLSTQAKLLRALQEKVIEKVGDHRPIPVDVRIITATNQDLERLMKQGRFREDLFFRINVIPIHLPPLRDRREDIPFLVDHFIEKSASKIQKKINGLSRAALEMLMNYSWPGNVRELINVIDYALVLCPGGQIQPDHLPAMLQRQGLRPAAGRERPGEGSGADEREMLLQALSQAGGRKAEAARLLGISRVTLWKRLKTHNLEVARVIRGDGF